MHRVIKSAVESKDGERLEHPYVTRSHSMKIAEDFTDWYDKNRSTIIKNVLTIWKTTKDTGYAVLIDQHWDRPMPPTLSELYTEERVAECVDEKVAWCIGCLWFAHHSECAHKYNRQFNTSFIGLLVSSHIRVEFDDDDGHEYMEYSYGVRVTLGGDDAGRVRTDHI